jgi:hypothetical protein
VGSPSQALRTCTLLDGLTYDTNGVAGANGPVERDMRYTWLWVLQRPSSQNRNRVTMTVVVYDKRGTFPIAETPFTGVGVTPGQSSLTLPTDSGVQKGTWIMDGTTYDSTTATWFRHAIFYRVVSATDNGAGALNVELQTPIRRLDGGSGSYVATIVVLTGVSEVFARPDLTP